jgi:hypothetical protein
MNLSAFAPVLLLGVVLFGMVVFLVLPRNRSRTKHIVKTLA